MPTARPSRGCIQPGGDCADHARTRHLPGNRDNGRATASANARLPTTIRPQGSTYASPSLYPRADPHDTANLAQRDLADLNDVARLLALHQHAIARGWLQGGEAAQLNVVAAAVHARRVGIAPCRLFVALLRDQRWEVITQEDEDQARALLRVSRDGPPRRRIPEACAPEPEAALSDDARFVLRAAQVLRQAGWQGELFLGVKLVDPTWTRERWDHAQAALAQWQQQQGRARWQGSGLEARASGWESGEDLEAKETDEGEAALAIAVRPTQRGALGPPGGRRYQSPR